MKPVAIFRHSPTEGPGYLAEFLTAHEIPWKLISIDEGEIVPDRAHAYAGLVFMGGPMSVNDPLPWIAPVLTLIRQAVAEDIPVLGHCLGGQLMAKALGGVVSRNADREIGWGEVVKANHAEATEWFGEAAGTPVFHWHGETFSLPEGAALLLSSAHCRNQAFSIGKHLGMQCHVEMTEAMIRTWCEIGKTEISEHIQSPGVQSADTILTLMPERLPGMRKMAVHVYERWIRGLAI